MNGQHKQIKAGLIKTAFKGLKLPVGYYSCLHSKFSIIHLFLQYNNRVVLRLHCKPERISTSPGGALCEDANVRIS